MSAVVDLVRGEIERLRREGEQFRVKSKECFQRADVFEEELNRLACSVVDQNHSTLTPTSAPPPVERGGRASAIVRLLDANPDRIFSPELIEDELKTPIDPSLVSRLKKQGRIAKAKAGGYCSIRAPEGLKEEQRGPANHSITDSLEGSMTQ